ncbi:MAG: substrate-binding domain-containing protein [Tepidisphaeraceae bacterium]|jgi:ribose transport system substrate-binding protein
MNKGIWVVFVVLIVGAVALVVFRKEQSETTPVSSHLRLTIAVIPKGTTHSYWNSVKAGATQAGKDLGVDMIYKGSMQEDDRAGQISVVEQFVSDNVNGIVLAPVDNVALVPAVQAATAKKIPVIIIDSPVNGDAGKDFVCYVGTNNKLAGKLGGDELARILGSKGKFILLRYAEGSASTMLREAGFLDAMKDNPGMMPLITARYAGTSVSEAQATALNMLDQIKQADGIFCPNESTTVGMLNVLEQNNLAGKIHFVGFDATPHLVEALRKGEIDALVSQNPIKMGYQGVKACVDYIKGVAQEPIQDSGVQLITRDNLDTPEVQKLLSGG